MLGKNSTTDLHITHSLLFMDIQLYCFVFWAIWNNSTHPLTFCVDIVFRVWSCVLRTEQMLSKVATAYSVPQTMKACFSNAWQTSVVLLICILVVLVK